MFKYLIVCILFCLPFINYGQTQKNIVLTDYSFAFLGTGDVRASNIGINYHRFVTNRLGFNVALNKTSGRGGDFLLQSEDGIIDFVNLRFQSNDDVVHTAIADYTIANIGISYRVNESTNQSLIIAAGLNHKWIQSNRISAYQSFSSNGGDLGMPQTIITLQSFDVQQERELAPYVAIDYVYYLFGDVSLGLHLAVNAGGNIVSSAGMNIGFRF